MSRLFSSRSIEGGNGRAGGESVAAAAAAPAPGHCDSESVAPPPAGAAKLLRHADEAEEVTPPRI
eukprot:COSAG01_NODE_258_length_20077_cov_124.162429_16_plen_65_part_00